MGKGSAERRAAPSQLIDYLEDLEDLEKLEKLENPETPSSTSAEKSQPFAENSWQAARNYPNLQYENQAFL